MRWYWGSLSFLVVLSLLGGCSENGTIQAPAVTPEVQVYYPLSQPTNPMDVSDSVDVYVGARSREAGTDPGHISKVEFWFVNPDTVLYPDLSVKIAESSQPISLADVPDSTIRDQIHLPEGWQLYTARWYTGRLRMGQPNPQFVYSNTYVQFFARAEDAAGSEGRSDLVRVRVLNQGDEIGPPEPASFIVTPTTGVVNSTNFVFDPSPTLDQFDPPSRVQIRWDFDGDGVWDVGNWDDPNATPVHANEPQERTFSLVRLYVVRMQARNSYLPQVPSEIAERGVRVVAVGGEPRPPEAGNYVEPDPGVYPMGAPPYDLHDPNSFPVSENETPLHYVDLRQRFKIERTEVTNRLYLDYVRSAIDSSIVETPTGPIKRGPQLVFRLGKLMYKNQEAPDDTTWVFLSLDPTVTKIYYDLTTKQFKVDDRYLDHPVTGVTWYGASAYALFYGLRLPTEAEWEVSARGAHPDYFYPFEGGTRIGDDPWKRINYRDSWLDDHRSMGTTPRGYFNGTNGHTDTPSMFGLYDMAGNVGEWVGDWLGAYPTTTENAPAIDPQGPIEGTDKVIRGGSFRSSKHEVRCTGRIAVPDLEVGYDDVGFRTAYSVFDQ
jgi:formylglycine-generating enzyme required for sulfatase activity